MTARTGLLIAVLALALGGALYLLLDGGTAPAVEAGPVPGSESAEAPADEGTQALELDAPAVLPDEATESGRTAVAAEEDVPEAAALEAPVAAARADVAVLSGFVKDEQGGPVEGARILVSRNALELMAMDTFNALAFANPEMANRFVETTTDESGFFEIVAIPPGQPGLKVFAPGFVPRTKTDLLIAAGEHQELASPIVLDASAVVSGVVYDDSGFPLAGATVKAAKKKSGMMGMAMASMSDDGVPTADDGSFRLDTLEPGELEVVASHPAYVDAKVEVDVRDGGTNDPLELRLTRGASILGRVTGLTDGAAERLQITAFPNDFNFMQGLQIRSCDVALDGSFELSGLQDGSQWNVFGRVTKEGEEAPEGAGMMLMWAAPGIATNRAEAAAGDRDVELVFQPATTVSFKVVDQATGRPISRLKIFTPMDFQGAQLEDYPGGLVRREELRPAEGSDQIQLTIDADGYPARTETIEPTTAGEVDLGVLELVPAVMARFLIVDRLTGAPVEGATVAVQRAHEAEAASGGQDAIVMSMNGDFSEGGRKGESDTKGFARVETGLEGSFVVTARASGYAPLEQKDVSLVGADVTPVTLELERGATVLVSAADTFGQPLPARTIEHLAPGATQSFAWDFNDTGRVTDLSGVARFENLEPGTHRFRIAKLESADEPNMMMMMMMAREAGADDDDETWAALEIAGTENAELQLVELPTGGLTGRVSEQGKALRSAKLTLRKVEVDDEADEEEGTAEAMFRQMGREMGGEGSSTAKTERDGSYAFESVDVGDYVLSIDYRKRAMPTEFAVTVVAGDQVLDFDLDVAILEGKVLDANGDGVKGVKVSVAPYVEAGEDDGSKTDMARKLMGEVLGVESRFRAFKTKRNGAFELRGITPDVKVVVVVDGSGAGYQDATSEPIELRRNESRDDLELVVRQGGTLDVTVLKEDGSSADFALVRLERTDGSLEPLNELAMGGVKTITGLSPGSYRVVADDDPDEDAVFGDGDMSTIGKVETTVEIVGGETTTIELRLPE